MGLKIGRVDSNSFRFECIRGIGCSKFKAHFTEYVVPFLFFAYKSEITTYSRADSFKITRESTHQI
jgi:hypothetical protein